MNEPGTNRIRVLCVDGDPDAAASTATLLEGEDERFDVETATSVGGGLDSLAAGGFDCVVSGHDAPGLDGLAFLRAVRDAYPDLPFLLFAGDGSEAVASEAIAAGVTDYLPKADDRSRHEALANRLLNAVGRSRPGRGAEPELAGPGYDAAERRRHEREREATVAFLESLYEVTIDVDLAFEEKIGRLLELGRAELDLPYGFLTRIDDGDGTPGSETQTVVDARGDHELLQPGRSCPLSQAYCRRTIEEDGLLAIRDANEAGWEADPAFGRFELGCYVGSKLVVDDELYGTICFASTAPRGEPFTETERTFVRLMAGWASYELERKRTTAEIERQNERLAEFASVVSHDLRSPLNVAQGRIELAGEEPDDEHLDAAADALARCEALIDDLLTLSRRGDRVFDVEPIALAELARRCWQNTASAAATLVVDAERTIPADRDRLQQLLENLFANAVEHGGENVTVRLTELDDGFAVEDDGEGIPAAERDRAFEVGYSTAANGTGFGLHIVERIADAHGWTIAATDGDRGGARFEITGVGTGP